MITLRGATTKSRRTRVVPIGTARLLAVLEWLRLDSEGEHKADVPVFSNEAGEALQTFKKAWVVAVLKAHGVNPRWREGSYKDLSTECQQRCRDINLHWHDLRHEYASRRSARSRNRFSRPSGTTISDWKRCRQPLNVWKEARRSTRRSKRRTNFQESFKIPRNRASLNAKTPPRNPLQVADKFQVGGLVPVRGFEPRFRG